MAQTELRTGLAGRCKRESMDCYARIPKRLIPLVHIQKLTVWRSRCPLSASNQTHLIENNSYGSTNVGLKFRNFILVAFLTRVLWPLGPPGYNELCYAWCFQLDHASAFSTAATQRRKVSFGRAPTQSRKSVLIGWLLWQSLGNEFCSSMILAGYTELNAFEAHIMSIQMQAFALRICLSVHLSMQYMGVNICI